MLALTTEQIAALAPDEASRKAGQGLSKAGKWVTVGGNARAVWGECQGSGSKPYKTVVDAEALAFKCSCPSRKFPCKHGLGLLLYLESDTSRFVETPEPEWVSTWLDKRTEKAASAGKKEEDKKVADPATVAKRSAARDEKVRAGLEELHLWMSDIIRGGLLLLPEKKGDYFDAVAKRMIDAQLPGVAATLRHLGQTNLFAEGWETEVLDQFAQLHLAQSGYGNIEAAEDPLLPDIRRYLGFPQSADLLETQPVISDTWMVLGSEFSEEGSLRMEKHWLQSAGGHTALFLQYIPYGGQPALNLFAGSTFTGDVRYYPGEAPLRVAIKTLTLSKEETAIPALPEWEAVTDRESKTLAQAPFTTVLPAVVAGLKPVLSAGKEWLLEDTAGKQMQLAKEFPHFWKWLSISGGQPLTMAVLGSEHIYLPLGVWHQNRYFSFA